MSTPDPNALRAKFKTARDIIRDFRRLREDPQTDETLRANARKALEALRAELGAESPVGNRGVFLPPHGGYRELEAFKNAEFVYDATVVFCEKHIDRFSRTKDQMVQAARSGRQNIAEGSAASGTSKEMELKLVNVARASLEELLLDYEDFLRHRSLPKWDKHHPKAKIVRKLAYKQNKSYATYKPYTESSEPEIAANATLCLIHQTNFLLNQLITQLEKAFLADGGLRERMTCARIQARNLQRGKGG